MRSASELPFDANLLDRSLESAGVDVALVTSKHNLQYLLGGYRYFFHDHIDAIGVSRYLPILIYVKGRPQDSIYVANEMEKYEKELGKFWVPTVEACSWGTLDAIGKAIEHLRKLDAGAKTIGLEGPFFPADAYQALLNAHPQARIADAVIPLERLRARKTPAELELVRRASDAVVQAMLAVIASQGPGTSKQQLVNALKREEIQRDLTFEYCLITAGTSHNRAPSEQLWAAGDILSLDSGGNYKGYIGDLCRMAILGEPDAELEDLLAEIETIQQAARRPIRPGTRGGDIFTQPERLIEGSANRAHIRFMAHGMGLIGHEAPRLSRRASQGYPGDDADLPLEAGMVISIETTMQHPRRGYIKLEDTVAITEDGWEAYGDEGRGWNRGAG